MIVTVSDDGSISDLAPRTTDSLITDPLPGVALLPGFVNAHSHVFQRALRGHTHRPLSKQDTFWTWRRAMYAEAGRLDPDLLYPRAPHPSPRMLRACYSPPGHSPYFHPPPPTPTL